MCRVKMTEERQPEREREREKRERRTLVFLTYVFGL